MQKDWSGNAKHGPDKPRKASSKSSTGGKKDSSKKSGSPTKKDSAKQYSAVTWGIILPTNSSSRSPKRDRMGSSDGGHTPYYSLMWSRF